MGKDTVEKCLEEYEDVFADVFDNLFLGGKGIIREEDLISKSASSYVHQNDGRLRGGMRDIRMESHSKNKYRLICGIENQTNIDNTMPERIMGYEYADYEAQIKRIMVNNKKKKRSAGARRVHKYQKLNPVITGVLYYGDKEWKHPLCLHDMLQFPNGLEEVLKPYVADYPMNLIQVARLTEEERGRLTSDFRIVAEYLACKDDKEKWTDFLKGSKEIIHVEELLDVIAEISKDEHYVILRDKIRKENRRKERWDMCKIAEELERVGVEKGRVQGLAEGREEGREEGLLAMIQDNLEMGLEKEKILEKTMRFFSVTWEKALKYYSQVAAE